MTARSVGPALVLGAVVAGTTAGERAGASPARLGLVLAVLAFAAALGCAWAGRGLAGLALLCGAAFLGGTAAMARALDGQAHSPLAGAIVRRESATIRATLTADPTTTQFSARTLARVDVARFDAGPRPAGARTVVVDASGDAAGRLGVLQAGDRVRLRGYFRPLDDYEARTRWRHTVGTFAADDVLGFRPAASPLLQVANALRGRVLAGHGRMPEPQRALVAGFLLGDTSDLPSSVVDDFRAAGMSHLVAVSGQNVAFVLAIVGPALRRGPLTARFAVGLLVLVVFAAMTRWEPSVLRASAMAACSMAALAAGRPTAGLRALALAATGLLLADPFLVHSVAFQLSCAASAGIAALGPALAARLPGPRPLAEAVGVTVAAQLAVTPVLLVVFGSVPLVAVPANVVVAPVAGPLTVLGLVGGVLGGAVDADVVAAVASFPAFACASVVLAVARVAAGVPLAVDAPRVAAAVAVGVPLFAWRRSRRATWRRARSRASGSRLALPPR